MQRLWCLSLVVLLAGCGTSRAPTSSNGSGDAERKTTASDGTTTATSSAHTSGIELAIVDYQGIMEAIAAHRGKVVVMDAWATSCPPCMKEFHNLVELHKQYGPDKVACISLSFDYEGLGTPEEQAPRVLKFLESQGATFENLMSNEESDALYRKFDLAAVPAVFVYDRAGKLRKRFDNQQATSADEQFTYKQVKELVAQLVDEPAGP
jgi:thiol-disulfide isomerase/thioredoxin